MLARICSILWFFIRSDQVPRNVCQTYNFGLEYCVDIIFLMKLQGANTIHTIGRISIITDLVKKKKKQTKTNAKSTFRSPYILHILYIYTLRRSEKKKSSSAYRFRSVRSFWDDFQGILALWKIWMWRIALKKHTFLIFSKSESIPSIKKVCFFF